MLGLYDGLSYFARVALAQLVTHALATYVVEDDVED